MARKNIQTTVEVEVTACDVDGCTVHQQPGRGYKAEMLEWNSIKGGGGKVLVSICPQHMEIIRSGAFVLTITKREG